jgi:hypothetical protein
MLQVAASALAGAESEVEEVEELLSALDVTELFSAVEVEGSEGVVGRVEGGPGCASGGVALGDAGVVDMSKNYILIYIISYLKSYLK